MLDVFPKNVLIEDHSSWCPKEEMFSIKWNRNNVKWDAQPYTSRYYCEVTWVRHKTLSIACNCWGWHEDALVFVTNPRHFTVIPWSVQFCIPLHVFFHKVNWAHTTGFKWMDVCVAWSLWSLMLLWYSMRCHFRCFGKDRKTEQLKLLTERSCCGW